MRSKGFVSIVISVLVIGFIVSSCTKTIELKLPLPKNEIVVEGHIENGHLPLVLLSRNQPYFGGISYNDYAKYFVDSAKVTVWDDEDTVQLAEIDIDTLLGGVHVSIPIYTTFDTSIKGIVGKTYYLKVESDTTTLTSVTTIPQPTPLDSIWWQPHPIAKYDSLVNLYYQYTDPPAPGNYVRYFTKRNSEPFYPGFNSVYDDKFVNGQKVQFIMERGESRSADFDPETYGFFWHGDTIIVKWCAIDYPHYKFWATLEEEMNQGGPFSSNVVIQGNIDGGLGIWGGYSASYDTLIVPPQ